MGEGLNRSGLQTRTCAEGSGASSNEMARLTRVAAQAVGSPALTFIKGEWALGTAGSIQIHGDVVGGRRG